MKLIIRIIRIIGRYKRVNLKVHLTNSSFADLKTFFLIHNVETMNFNCINALLKNYRRAPENTIIIIFSNNLRNIPKKTILSRCLKLKFKISMSNFFLLKKMITKKTFYFVISTPQIFKILNNEEGEEIKKIIIIMLKKKSLEVNEFYILYSKVSENFHNYFLIVVYIIFYDVKSKISSKFFDLNKTKNALFYLDFIKI